MKLATLGPKGTYSVQAAKAYAGNAEIVTCNTIKEAISRVALGATEQAVVPLENSIQGVVAESLDSLASQPELLIVDELVLDIHHALWALNRDIKPADVQKIYSHPQALSQCSKFIAQNYPTSEIITTTSTAAGVQLIAIEQDSHALAIGSESADEQDMHIIARNIEDEPGNQTRFIVISKQPGFKQLDFIIAAVLPGNDRPGLLYDILGIVKNHQINIQQIESRPNRAKLGSYIFYIRLEMKSDDNRFKAIANDAAKINVNVRKMSA